MGTAAYAMELLDAARRGRSIPAFTSRDAAFDLAAAYAVAEAVHRARVADGARPVGRKIGFTNRRLWARYGVHQPIWGHVYDTTLTRVAGDRAGLSLAGLVEPLVEPEIVLRLRAAPPAGGDERGLLDAVDWVARGFEIVQSPFPGWRFRVEDTVAANGLHGALVVGPGVPVAAIPDCARRLRELRIALRLDGVVRAEGAGADVLDSPLLALAHLVEVLAGLPRFAPLGAGELVTTGTLTPALPAAPGQVWSTTLEGLELPGFALALR